MTNYDLTRILKRFRSDYSDAIQTFKKSNKVDTLVGFQEKLNKLVFHKPKYYEKELFSLLFYALYDLDIESLSIEPKECKNSEVKDLILEVNYHFILYVYNDDQNEHLIAITCLFSMLNNIAPTVLQKILNE